MANYEVQIKLREDGAYNKNLYPTVPPAVSGQITKNAQDINALKDKALTVTPNTRLYYNAAGGGSSVTIRGSGIMNNYSCVVATIKGADDTIMNTSPMYFHGNIAEGFASTWGSTSVGYAVHVNRFENDHDEAGIVVIRNASSGELGGSLIALIGVI